MNKTLLIIRREYLSRITKKTFILSTILTPLLFVGVFALSIYLSTNSSEELHIAVYDETGIFASKLTGNEQLQYEVVDASIYEAIKSGKEIEPFNGVLYIPAAVNMEKPEGIRYISGKQLGIFSDAQVENDLNNILLSERMIRAGIDTLKLHEIRQNKIKVGQQVVTDTGQEGAAQSREADSGVSYLIGYISGFLIYILVFIYGSMVMRGVMEEKVSRIAEVVVSSVKPTQLMMGKIIGIGAVGLTQFLIWIILLSVGSVFLAMSVTDPAEIQQIANAAGNAQHMMKDADTNAVLAEINQVKDQLNMPLLIGMFIFYFITGYLFYAALFAAVGSAVNEDPQDAQAMMMPITIPIIFSIIIMTTAVANPTGQLSVWCSIIPFTSPIIMMARLPFGVPGTVPYWQLILSVVCMVAGFLFTTWLSARIYRTGILLYGKKPNWKEMLQWVFRKN